MQEKRMIEKTDGNGNTFMVENPEYLTLEGKFKKVRRKITNLTPKKKRRK